MGEYILELDIPKLEKTVLGEVAALNAPDAFLHPENYPQGHVDELVRKLNLQKGRLTLAHKLAQTNIEDLMDSDGINTIDRYILALVTSRIRL